MFGNHLKESRKLMELRRYPTFFKHRKRSVAEHSWFVSKVAHGLATWEKNKFGNTSVDIEKVMFMAINHDVLESYTGDIITTTKNSSQLLKNELEKVEKVIMETQLLETIPKSWGNSYMLMHEEMSELESTEAKIVKAADLLDRVFECMEEIELGNMNPYVEILKVDIPRLYSLGLMSVHYFLKYSINDIHAQDYIPENIKKDLEAMDFSKYF